MSDRDVPGKRLGADLSKSVITTNRRARSRFIHLLRIGLEKRERLQRTLIAFQDVNRNARFQDYRERIFGVLEKIVDTVLTNDAIYEKVRQHVLRRYGTYRSMKRKALKENLDENVRPEFRDSIKKHEADDGHHHIKKMRDNAKSPQEKVVATAAMGRIKNKWKKEASDNFKRNLEVSPQEAKRVNDRAFKRPRGMEPRSAPRSSVSKTEEPPAAKKSLLQRMMGKLGRG